MNSIEVFRLSRDWSYEYPATIKEVLPNGLRFSAIARFLHAGDHELCFCDRLPENFRDFSLSESIILCKEGLVEKLREHLPNCQLIVLDDPRAVFLDLVAYLSSKGAIEPSSLIGDNWGVSPDASVGEGSRIHSQARIDAGARVGSNCVIGRGAWVQAGASIADGTVVGVHGINAYRASDGRVLKFPHLAGVIVGENSEIGANSVLVAGVLNSTLIGKGCVLGNLCNIGHGVVVGDSVWMSVGCKIGGHTSIGSHATIGMGALVRDNISIGDRAHIGMGSVIIKSVPSGRSMFGNPARAMPGVLAGPAR